MTETEVLEKFRRYKWLIREIEHLAEQLDRIRSARKRMTPILSDLPKTHNRDGTIIETSTEKLFALELRIAAMVSQLTDLRIETEELVGQLDDPKARMLVRMKYIDGLTWEEISDRVYLDERWVRRLAKNAIKEIALKNPLHLGL